MQSTNSYDEVPYRSFPYAQTHPDRMAVLGRLHGLRPADVSRCRVLELAACSGGNLLPMAEQCPDSEFVGIDLSEVQVKLGQDVISTLGLKNVKLLHQDIMDVGEDLGKFDYILAHGVYSWVPDAVQNKMLAVCRALLNPQGIGYISYNTLPGWRMRGIIRDIMMFRSRDFTNPFDRISRARSLVDFLSKATSSNDNAYSILLRQELDALRGKDDSYLLHEHLEQFNEPLYFHEFASRAQAAGLQFLCEAEFGSSSLLNTPAHVRTVIESISRDVIELEQYTDFLRNRTFRQTLLCHAEARVDREVRPSRLQDMYISSPVRPVMEKNPSDDLERESFKGPSATTTTSDPILKAALKFLGANWPNVVPFVELLAIVRSSVESRAVVVDTRDASGVERLAQPLLNCYASAQIRLSTHSQRFTSKISEQPLVSPLARYQSDREPLVTNRLHESVRLTDLERRVLTLLDGKTSRDEICVALAGMASRGELLVQSGTMSVRDVDALKRMIDPQLDQAMQKIANSCLLLD